MIDLLCAFDLRRVMWEILVDGEVEVETAALVHSFVRFDSEGEVQDIIGVREGCFHSAAESAFELRQV